MSKFGKYAIVDEVVHHFEKEPDWWWKINPPTSGDVLNRSKFMFQGRVVTQADGTTREYPPTSIEVAHHEIALTFGGTNMPELPDKPVEDGGAPYITKDLGVDAIEHFLSLMPFDMVMEIWRAVGDACPGWGPERKNAPTKIS